MILLPDLYKDKAICLIGSGASADNYTINFDNYDIVVGINRIYQTKYIEHINVIYNALSKMDWHNIQYMITLLESMPKFKFLIACPWAAKRSLQIKNIISKSLFKKQNKNFLFCRNIVREVDVPKRPLTGIAALNHMVLSGSLSVDIYGFDFYDNHYINNLKKYNHGKFHDLRANKQFLLNIINNKNYTVNWLR